MAIKRRLERDGNTYIWPRASSEVIYVDVEGNSLTSSECYFFGPNFHKLYPDIRTYRDLYEQWIEPNRSAVVVQSDEGCGLAQTILSFVCRQLTSQGVWTEDLIEHAYTRDLDNPLIRILSIPDDLRLLLPDLTTPFFMSTDSRGRSWYPDRKAQPVDSKWSSHHNYSYKMGSEDFNFYRSLHKSNSELYFGLELEINTKLSAEEIQSIVTDFEPKQEPFFIFKQDASIGGRYQNNLEIVTVPCSPSYLKKNFRVFFKKLRHLAAKKDIQLSSLIEMENVNSNGLHIHVSKDAFLYRFHKNRFITLMNSDRRDNKNFFALLSKRSRYWENSYCFIDSSYRGVRPAYAIKSTRGSSERHSVCHSLAPATIEVRLFSGIPDIEHICSCIEFTEAIFNFTRFNSVSSISNSFIPDFKRWLGKQSRNKYRSLTKRVKQCA